MSASSDIDLLVQPEARKSMRRDRGASASQPAAPYTIEDHYWGYVVRSACPPSLGTVVFQGASWILGLVFIVAAVGLLVLPSQLAQADLLGFRLGSAVILGGLGVFCMWFASRGSLAELQIDTAQGEVREVVRNRAGRPTVLGRYGFDVIGGVFLERAGPGRRSDLAPGHAELVLRYRNTAQVLRVVSGPEAELEALRDRLGVDLVVRPRLPLRQPAEEPVAEEAA